MADLRRTSFWDRLLLPAFVYYFKLLYPFALSNSQQPPCGGSSRRLHSGRYGSAAT
jgi:hypothetical protein